jgi:transposase-like protein
MHCPRCKKNEAIKNGIVRGLQRWKCKQCGCNYTQSEPPGYPRWMRRRALELYLEGVGFRGIGRLLGVTNVTVLYWIRELGEAVEKIRETVKSPSEVQIVELDEMWHYVQKKRKNFGSGSLMIGSEKSRSPLNVEIVMIGPAKNFSQKSKI